MEHPIHFNDFSSADPSNLSKSELLDWLARLRTLVAQLDETEPADMESEEYNDWGEQHETLEDLIDDILDRLEDL